MIRPSWERVHILPRFYCCRLTPVPTCTQVELPPSKQDLAAANMRALLKKVCPNCFRAASGDDVFSWGDRIRVALRIELDPQGKQRAQEPSSSSSSSSSGGTGGLPPTVASQLSPEELLLADTSAIPDLNKKWLDLDSSSDPTLALLMAGVLGKGVGAVET